LFLHIKLSFKVSKKAAAAAASHFMKRIDWKEVSSNSQISKDLAIQIFNRFQSLSTTEINSDNIDDVYENLIKST